MIFIWLALVMIWCILGFCAYGFLCNATEIIVGKDVYKKYYKNYPGAFILWFACLIGGLASFIISLLIFLIHKHYAKRRIG